MDRYIVGEVRGERVDQGWGDMVKRVILTAWFVGLMASPESGHTTQQRGTPLAAAVVPADPSAVGYLNLHKRHPDAAEGAEEFTTDYAVGPALQRLGQMQGFLASFGRLTDRVRRTLPEADLRAVGNTAADMQTIGFHNIPLIVEGTILKQDYQLRQAQYELTKLRRAHGEISAQALDSSRAAYVEATKRLQVFWDTKLPTD